MIAALFLLLAVPDEGPRNFAEQHDIEDAEAVTCFNREMSRIGMNQCARQEYDRADKQLNRLWAEARAWAKGDKQSARLLLESQRSWLRYRDAQCAVVVDEDRGGSIVPLVHLKCMTGMTRGRTEALAQLMDTEGR